MATVIEPRPVGINTPDEIEKWHYTLTGKHIVFVRFQPDEDCSDPSDGCGFGKFYSFSSKHSNFLEPENRKQYLSDSDTVRLSYYEHDASLWFVDGIHKGAIPDREWDCVDFAGLWVPDESVKESCPDPPGDPERWNWMRQEAEAACQVYSDWCNDWCYGYDIEVYLAKKDNEGEVLTDHDVYQNDEPVVTDNCWGYIGDDSVKESAIEAAQHLLASTSSNK
jgi:hypothetical protein